MSKKTDPNLIVGLDIGTSKVVAIVGETNPDGTMTVVGLGVHPSRGLKKGVVVNIDSTVQSIRQAVDFLAGRGCTAIASSSATGPTPSLDRIPLPVEAEPLIPAEPTVPQRDVPGLF